MKILAILIFIAGITLMAGSIIALAKGETDYNIVFVFLAGAFLLIMGGAFMPHAVDLPKEEDDTEVYTVTVGGGGTPFVVYGGGGAGSTTVSDTGGSMGLDGATIYTGTLPPDVRYMVSWTDQYGAEHRPTETPTKISGIPYAGIAVYPKDQSQ